MDLQIAGEDEVKIESNLGMATMQNNEEGDEERRKAMSINELTKWPRLRTVNIVNEKQKTDPDNNGDTLTLGISMEEEDSVTEEK